MNRLTDCRCCGLEDCPHSLNIATATTEGTALIGTGNRHANPDSMAIDRVLTIDTDRLCVIQEWLK
jgi:hypothetical protein